jgi:cbb3-type cytochrome oxidase subunit 3
MTFIDIVLFLEHNSIVVVMGVFCLIVLWAYWPSHKTAIEADAQIPFNDDK